MTARRVVRRLLSALRPAAGEADLARELASHRDLLEAEYRRRGLAPADARAAARRALGSTALTMDLHRDARSFAWLDDLRRDVRYAVRTLRRTPGFTVLAILTLALGIGATTAIFTLINDVLLRTLPVRDPRNLVVFGDARGSGTAVGRQGGSFTLFSYELYRRLRDEGAFESLCAVQSSKSRVSVRLPAARASEPTFARLVSTNYFDVLGTRAVVGRVLAPGDGDPSAPPAAVVSFRYWADRLHRDPSIVGSAMQIDRVPVTIVGVAAPGFYGETLEPDPPSFWIPLPVERQLTPSRSLTDAPDIHWLYLLGRLRPDVTVPQAQARVTATLQAWLRERQGGTLSAEQEGMIAATRIPLRSGENGITHARRDYGSALQLLLAISSVVLLIACANIANLLLARAAARETEIAIRRAIGASRGRLIRQSLAESLTLALAGGGLGLLVASWGVSLLLALVFSDTDYVPFSTSPDARVLAFTVALSGAAALAFGLLPALRGSGAASPRQTHSLRWGNALVVVQVAMSLVVLAAAGALARSLANLARQEFGFARERVLVIDIDPARAGYDVNRLGPLYRDLFARLNAIPGVTSAAFSYYSPFDECCWAFTIAAQGYAPPQDESRSAMLNRVSPRYFETLGTAILRGRALEEADAPAAPLVAVVNEAFARRFLRGDDPIGRRFSIGDGGAPGVYEIVGLVQNAKYDSPRDRMEPMAFLPMLQREADEDADDAATHFIRTIEVRALGDPSAVAGAVRQTLAAIDPNLPVLRIATLSDQVGRALNGEHVVASLAGFFGAVALVLTCVGLYGLTAYGVQRRTREIGIRVALGANRAAVVAMVVRGVLRQSAIGTLAGLPAAFVAIRLIEGALFGVSPADPREASMAAGILLACMLAAGYLPARRASRIEPVDALRHE
jgi:predicted permease